MLFLYNVIMKNNKIKLVISILFLSTLLLGIVGVTFSYFNHTSTLENEFNAGVFSTSATEVFTSPTNWLPGDETPKTLSIKNEGNIPMAVRVSYTESWKDSNNQDLPLSVNNVPAAIINFDNTDKWSKRGDYYYYNGSLDANETAASPVKSVTFNKDIVTDTACTTTNGVTSCTTTYNGYEDATYTLTFLVDTVQFNMVGEAWPEGSLYYVVKEEYDSGSGYVGLYTGNHKDSFTREATKDIYYYTTVTTDDVTEGNILLDKTNVLFAGYCWQMIRTTDTGGVKMIYNGIPVDGKCENTRSDISGLNQGYRTTNSFTGTYAYGTDYAYDRQTGIFTLSGTIKNTDYTNDKSVIGMYTCKKSNANDTCTTVYYLDEESDTNNYAYSYSYMTTTYNYSFMGRIRYNETYNSPAYVGYMYNKLYKHNEIKANTINKYGVSTTWDGTKYTLNNVLETTLGDYPLSSSISSHHYFCLNNSIECNEVGFIYYYLSDTFYYMLLENGVETSNEVLNEMLYADDVNTKDSSIKRFVEEWYSKNLLNYDRYIEETIYCNDRSIRSLNGWNDNGGNVYQFLFFKEETITSDLSCSNVTDQFSVDNNKAKLKYKIGLASSPEMNLINNKIYRNPNVYYWLSSPSFFNRKEAWMRDIFNGIVSNTYITYDQGVRPVISLAAGVVPSSGTGTMTDPYVISTN